MPADETGAERVVLSSDEDWKDRVKAEDAALDKKIQSESAPDGPAAEATADDEFGGPMPPPTFTTLVSLFSTQAMVALGLIPNPATGKADPRFDVAKHFIDMLSVLEEKTRRNLTGNEAQFLEMSLHQLRLAFVELQKGDGKSQ
ncbi:MAG: DUF1844 domain-containing protein [Planctomycetaceae bacterium]